MAVEREICSIARTLNCLFTIFTNVTLSFYKHLSTSRCILHGVANLIVATDYRGLPE